MARTTVEIDDPVLRDLRALQGRERKTMGELVSELLAEAIARRRGGAVHEEPFVWDSQPMGERVDLANRDALLDRLDRGDGEDEQRP